MGGLDCSSARERVRVDLTGVSETDSLAQKTTLTPDLRGAPSCVGRLMTHLEAEMKILARTLTLVLGIGLAGACSSADEPGERVATQEQAALLCGGSCSDGD